MAIPCKRRVCINEKRGFPQDLDSWRCKLIDCVGGERILTLSLGTRILEDLSQFKANCKPASVSNWSFDENCLFCCLRREKVKDHVIALNNKIVESGGKPLLGKDNGNISRLEWQVEEFLNAVLHRKEYTPRIPDPHIPVVACDTIQQMINRLVVQYTSNKHTQDSPQHNGMDQSLVKTNASISPIAVATRTAAASTQNPVLSKLLMEDQDVPLDLSVKKVRPEVGEQDCVLDLSIKRNRDPDSMLLSSPCVNLTTPARRQSSDSGFAKATDLQSSSTFEEFMAKLCLHHQRQIVDAFGFLQTEVKAVTSSSELQVSTPTVAEKTSSHCAEETSQGTLPVADSPVSENNEDSPAEQPLNADGPSIASIKNGSSIDLGQKHTGDNNDDDVECSSTDFQPKCSTLLIVKKTKTLSDVGAVIQEPTTGTLDQVPCASDTQSQINDHDARTLSSCSMSSGHTDPKCRPVLSNDMPGKICSVQRTKNDTSSGKAKKSSRGCNTRLRHGLIGNIVNDPDVNCDVVFVKKPITECKPQSQNYMLPRKTARKSTRGHLSFGDSWEIKTVRTLACISALDGSGSYPIPMPEITTSVIPKQALAKPDGLPAMTVPFTGDCMETVMSKNLPDQAVVTDIPGDVVEILSEDLIVEPSQTGQIQQKEQIPSLLPEGKCIQNISDSSESSKKSVMVNETTEQVEFTTKETVEASVSSVILSGLKTGVQGQDVATELLLNTVSLSIESDASNADGVRVGSELENQNTALYESPEETKCLREQVEICTDNSTVLQLTCGSTANTTAVDSTNPDKDKVGLSLSDFVGEGITTKGQLEECREGVSESPVTKKGVAKHAQPSDRCLRSGVSKGTSQQTAVSSMSDQAKLTDLQSDIHEKNSPESKHSSVSSKLKPIEENVPCKYNLEVTDLNPEIVLDQSPAVMTIDGNKGCTRQKLITDVESEQEKTVQEPPNPNDEVKGQSCVVNGATPCVNGDSPGKTSSAKSRRVSERMPLRKRSGQCEQSESCSPTKTIPRTPERMPRKSKNSVSVEQPVDEGPCYSPTAGPVEKLGRMPLRNRNSGFAEQAACKDSCTSPNPVSLDGVAHMPLRSRNANAVSCNVVEGSSDMIKIKDAGSGAITEQNNGEDSGVTSKKLTNAGQMSLRSGSGLITDQSFGSDAGNVSESPGRMSLRRSSTFSPEKQDCLSTPPKRKKLSPRLQKSSRTSLLSLVYKGGDGSNSANIKTDKLSNDQLQVFSIPDSFTSFNQPTTSPLIPSPCKFLQALNGEANQHLISDLNSKFEKMQKGWVQMDKEGQPAPKPKNKSDRLKEIWKSKRRIRKPRSIEQHRFSPVQMLFMKSFDLSNICRWFLQSTETKSLVIVKKVNTRLPSETQLGFQTFPSVPESSDGVFPSLQAERLKKHLKKFAIASPVKSNPKNKRLIAKALAQGMSRGKEKREPRTATRISSKPQCSTGLIQTQPLESHSKVGASTKNPASARILRKYSNMREKKQVQQKSFKNFKRSLVEVENNQPMTKKVSQEKLSTRRGQKSAIVKKVKRLASRAKRPVKERIAKAGGRGLRGINKKVGSSSKRVLPRLLKSTRVTAHKTMSKKYMLVKTDKSPQTKTDKKSPLHKSSDSLMSPSRVLDIKPLLSEDQVLTRSQRKMETTVSQTMSPKTSTKRGTETPVTLAKRTRTSK